MKRLRQTSYNGALTLEIDQKGPYLEKSYEEFLKIAYERIKRISALA